MPTTTPAAYLETMLLKHQSSPFLFVGSGFSQRYLGLPTWENLLREFCKGSSPFEYYFSSSDGKLPRCASLISKDFAEYWWKAPETAAQREKYKAHLKSASSPLKIAIVDFLATHQNPTSDPAIRAELEALKALNAEGIITTNWDNLLELIFPGYKTYIGQQSIVRQTPQNIGEIYKIHGCCSDPNSLVLTEDDYTVFREKQAYLAAKLITIFVEHPVVFLGYSVSDANILDLLRSILRGLGTDEIAKLQKNLIFVQRAKTERPASVRETILVVEETQLPVTNIISDDFVSVYSAISKSKLKLPARILRFCKEQLYEIVTSREPSDKLCLVDIEAITRKSDVEFIVGIGVAKSRVGERGYRGVNLRDLCLAMLHGEPKLEAELVLDHTIPALDFKNNFVPVHYFMGLVGRSSDTCNDSVGRLCAPGIEKFRTKGYADQAARNLQEHDLQWLIANLPPEKVALFVPHLPASQVPLPELKAFIVAHLERAFVNKYSTVYRKLICYYDYLAYAPQQTDGKRVVQADGPLA